MTLSKKEIERIIYEEIEVDAYDDDEIDMGWETHMMQEISYPFEAKCKIRRSGTANTVEKVKAIGGNSKLSSGSKVFCVDVDFKGLIFAVALEDLEDIKADDASLTAIAVWNGRNSCR